MGIRYSYEGDLEDQTETIVFHEVEAFRCTYHTAVGEEALDAYDGIADLGDTAWLDEVRRNLKRRGAQAEGLRHLMITFDGGPSYEFICRKYVVEHGADT